jgi:hypothetical protein
LNLDDFDIVPNNFASNLLLIPTTSLMV